MNVEIKWKFQNKEFFSLKVKIEKGGKAAIENSGDIVGNGGQGNISTGRGICHKQGLW